ncbi:MAG TPA: type I-E CRISPR-associated protein Cas6/Cse3/CasE [Candidatus Kapabacteria bacterium]|nr:type I-E CRISPR-associated protein Cas6/Cse3/CasE [Candidatus Kapabacteria bacterium]
MRNREARRDAAMPYELHRTLVSRGFGKDIERSGRILFRLEPEREAREHGGPLVMVQSSGVAPQWAGLLPDYYVRIDGPRTFEPKIERGQLLGFRLLANPVERQRQRDDAGNVLRSTGEKQHVRFHRRALLRPEEQEQWLERQGIVRISDETGTTVGGFTLRFVTIAPEAGTRQRSGEITHASKRSLPHVGVRFDGVLEVTDADAFINTLAAGIGPAKAFGFGYLSVAPLR